MLTAKELADLAAAIEPEITKEKRCGSDKLHQPHWEGKYWCDGKRTIKVT